MQDKKIPSRQSGEISREDALVEHLYAILTSSSLEEASVVPEELRDTGKLEEIYRMLWGIRQLALSLSNGELGYQCKERGFVVGALKSLQSNLRNLTWQAQRIASGEYNHRVNFLGDFSKAFNQMAEQLGCTISNLTCVSEEYKNLSYRDPLTGLYNRHAFFTFAQELLANAPPHQPSTLFIADLDHFKNINDTFGHAAGDEVLRVFSEKLLSTLRLSDLCCRYGGEEFVVLMPGIPLAVGISIVERLRNVVEETIIPHEGQEIRITASFGLYELEGGPLDNAFEGYMESCIQNADKNLYRAKESGRNRVVV